MWTWNYFFIHFKDSSLCITFLSLSQAQRSTRSITAWYPLCNKFNPARCWHTSSSRVGEIQQLVLSVGWAFRCTYTYLQYTLQTRITPESPTVRSESTEETQEDGRPHGSIHVYLYGFYNGHHIVMCTPLIPYECIKRHLCITDTNQFN